MKNDIDFNFLVLGIKYNPYLLNAKIQLNGSAQSSEHRGLLHKSAKNSK